MMAPCRSSGKDKYKRRKDHKDYDTKTEGGVIRERGRGRIK
jgi:hypothetical protein